MSNGEPKSRGGARPIGEVECPICGKMATRYHARQETCGDKLCSSKHRRAKLKKKRPHVSPFSEGQCGRAISRPAKRQKDG